MTGCKTSAVFKYIGVLLLAFQPWICLSGAQYINFPDFVVAKWFSLEDREIDTVITETTFKNTETSESRLVDYLPYNETIDANGNFDGKYLIHNIEGDCYQCYEILFKTVNVLQYRRTTCISKLYPDEKLNLEMVCQNIVPNADVITWFRTEVKTINCKTTWEGTFSFTYEVDQGGGSICKSPQSAVVACQEPGSVYVDNQVFTLNFGKCQDMTGSVSQKIRFQCMGSWMEGKNVFSAMMDIGEVKNRMKFRCMLTRADQQYADNTRYFALSRWAECASLKSPYDGPIRLKLWPAYVGHMGESVYGVGMVTPSCNFPRNFTGTWFTTAEFDSDVTINVTHIYFKTKLDQYTYKESVFICQQNRDSRYLVTAVTIGRCEVDYICFAFMPRHHNIIRWRMSKPYRLSLTQSQAPDAQERIFRQACTWSAFTLNRDDTAWRYYTFILNPPAPVPCPIGGRYNFTQIGNKEEHYSTRIKGITERPRHMIDCKQYVSELKSCDDFPKWLYVDAEYCATLDHTGKPISEYDQADRQLFCVGYWLEDMKSYMITYDMEDAVSAFRCWVYERRDWRELYASRAIRAMCAPQQTAYSSTSDEGASLALKLTESERLWDSCPQRYSTGANPYSQELQIFIVDETSSSNRLRLSVVLMRLTILGALSFAAFCKY